MRVSLHLFEEVMQCLDLKKYNRSLTVTRLGSQSVVIALLASLYSFYCTDFSFFVYSMVGHV